MGASKALRLGFSGSDACGGFRGMALRREGGEKSRVFWVCMKLENFLTAGKNSFHAYHSMFRAQKT